MLAPEKQEVELGQAEVRQTFRVPRLGVVAGCYVTQGTIPRDARVRLVRDGIVVYEGKVGSLRRFKDDVREVAAGYECGIGIEGYQDLKEGDVIEAFEVREVARSI
jgi:translation initiation factor IF-2